jgi:O-antigen/teichoic acid export membrane protein
MGFGQALVYYQNKRQAGPAQALSTMLVAVPVLGLLGVIVGQVALPWGFASQTDDTVQLARVFLCTVPFILGTEAAWAMLMANRRFAFLSGIRILQPFIYVGVLLALWALGHFTPFTVLASQAASYALTFAIAFFWLGRTVGLARPSLSLVRAGLGYGLRLQGVALAGIAAARLDMILLPAFVNADDLGFYTIAVNVASMVITLFGCLHMVVLPMATGPVSGASVPVVERGVRLSLLGAAGCVLVLMTAAPWLVSIVYGANYLPAVGPMRLLLPGLTLRAATSVLAAGLQAAGRPGSASIAQLSSLAVTVAGLVFLLPRFGIEGAALASSIAYAASFLFSWIALCRASTFRMRSALSPAGIVSDLRYLNQQLVARAARVREQAIPRGRR